MTCDVRRVTCVSFAAFVTPSQRQVKALNWTKEFDTYKFKGFLMDWGCCYSDFKVCITFEYDAATDSIEGEVHVDPASECEYGKSDAHGADYSFKGSKVRGR